MNNQTQSNFIERISIGSNGVQANGYSGSSSLSDDGSYISFESDATNLVPNNTNGYTDTFIYNRLNKTVELISIAPNGTQANGSSSSGSISGDGKYITYASFASNLVSGDTNAKRDIFVYNRIDKTTELISVAPDGTQANGSSYPSVISDDGRYIAYESEASNLVSGDTNGKRDIFVYDRIDKTTERINIAANGTQADGSSRLGSISDDGRYIVYESEASNLVSGDTDGKRDIFVYDRIEKTTQRINVAANGTQANGDSTSGSISGDGKYIVYESDASNLVLGDSNGKRDIFIYDRIKQTTERVNVAVNGTQSNGYSEKASLSDDGRYVAFLSDANNLVSNDTDGRANVFVRDRVTQTTARYTADSFPTLSGDGQNILFNSSISSLVAGDTNNAGDVFVINRGNPGMSRFTTENVHRFYQFKTGSHLYTTDQNEINVVKAKSAAGELSYQDEGEKYTVLASNKDALTGETIAGVKPIYRFFNTQTGSHLYTMDENEKTFIEQKLTNYSSEGVKYHAFEFEPAAIETIPVFRMLNSDSGSHLYTIDRNELNNIQANLPNYSLENNGNPVFHVFEL